MGLNRQVREGRKEGYCFKALTALCRSGLGGIGCGYAPLAVPYFLGFYYKKQENPYKGW